MINSFKQNPSGSCSSCNSHDDVREFVIDPGIAARQLLRLCIRCREQMARECRVSFVYGTPIPESNETAEEKAVRALGGNIGFGRIMHLAEKLWNELTPGGGFSVGPCSGTMVKCPCPRGERDKTGQHCEVCCGSGRITKRVAELIRS